MGKDHPRTRDTRQIPPVRPIRAEKFGKEPNEKRTCENGLEQSKLALKPPKAPVDLPKDIEGRTLLSAMFRIDKYTPREPHQVKRM